MKIDFNNVRRQAINSYNSLVKKMNESTTGGRLSVDPDYIRNDIDDLRMDLVGIACTYQPDDDDFKCVLEEGEKLLEFNPEEER